MSTFNEPEREEFYYRAKNAFEGSRAFVVSLELELSSLKEMMKQDDTSFLLSIKSEFEQIMKKQWRSDR